MQELLEKGMFSLEDNGEVVECKTLFTFYSEDYNKNYVVYTNGDGVHASIYDPDDTLFNLDEIVDEEELNMVNEQIMETVGEYMVKEGDE